MSIKRPSFFIDDETILPVTMKQFEDLTNEMIEHINFYTQPYKTDADYTAQVLMNVIHALDHKRGFVSKLELFEACINRISCHLTYRANEEIQRKIKEAHELSVVPNAINPETTNSGEVLENQTVQ
jgi:hypothetical protein